MFVFLVTLVSGYCLSQLSISSQPIVLDISDQQIEHREIITTVISASPEFVPEFRDLPNFEDIDYEKELKTKLVDVFQFEGVYRKSEVIAKSGETWLGLFEQNEKFALKQTKVTVLQERTSSYAGDENDARLKFDRREIPIFILKNAGSLKPGPIKSVYLRPSKRKSMIGICR